MPSRMSTKVVSIVICSTILVAAIWGCVSSNEPHDKVVARLQKKDAGGYTHTVTVSQSGGAFKTELADEGYKGSVEPVSSYRLYEGSDPITSATIKWPELHGFSVSFDNGYNVECSWSETNVVWTQYFRASRAQGR